MCAFKQYLKGGNGEKDPPSRYTPYSVATGNWETQGQRPIQFLKCPGSPWTSHWPNIQMDSLSSRLACSSILRSVRRVFQSTDEEMWRKPLHFAHVASLTYLIANL